MEQNFLDNLSLFLEDLLKIIKETPGKIIITGHINADLDALASAVGLKYFLEKIVDDSENKFSIVIPQMNKLAKKIYNDILREVKISTDWPDEIDLLIIVDTTDINMVDFPKNHQINIKKIVVMDHHLQTSDLDPRVESFFISELYSSATEIIIDLYRIIKFSPQVPISTVLLTGLLTDTGNFRYANVHTMETAQFLLETGLNIRNTINLLHMSIPRSERIARIRAAMRIEELCYVKDYVIAISHVSTYEASASKAMIELGADLSFMVAFDKKSTKFRISSRTSDKFLQETHLHLGKIMAEIGEKFHGSGGGHDGAAGCYGNTLEKFNMKEIENGIIEVLENALDEKEI